MFRLTVVVAISSLTGMLFVLGSGVPARDLVFDVAAFTIVAHGLTDTVGAAWVERRLAREREPVAAS